MIKNLSSLVGLANATTLEDVPVHGAGPVPEIEIPVKCRKFAGRICTERFGALCVRHTSDFSNR